MRIKFTRFVQDDNWVNGTVNDGEYTFSSKLFDEGSRFGINEGRVSKLTINEGESKDIFDWSNVIVNYDRGWDIEPDGEREKEVYESVLDFLENAPKTRF